MNFRRVKEHVPDMVVELEKAALDFEPSTESLRSLSQHPGFRYLLHILRLESSRVESAILRGTHTELSRVTFLQGARAGLRHVEQVMARIAGEPEPKVRDATVTEQQAFERAKALIEEVK